MPNSDPLKVRNVSVRLPDDAFETLASVARVDGVTMGEVIRQALAQYAVTRRSAEDWPEKVRALQRQLEAVLPPPQ
ncbi:CopG family transcriptional regulator [Tessaracoccus sp. MC1627]|uniref:ribbon-helix-helix domain-containing protein n=1 Tax=Tessaracoccus sp. MC1627 TaxID=2760312 RepID=UPI0016014D35|nr:CopG family transcriptional regulator [Tessaracoccus sp. MC1627]